MFGLSLKKMAATITKILGNSVVRPIFQKTPLCTPKIRSDNFRKQNRKCINTFLNSKNEPFRHRRVILAGIATAAASATLLAGKKYFESRGGDLLPAVSAATPFTDIDSTLPLSKRFNFIADTVEKAGPAVVYIEIKGRHPMHGRMVSISNGSGFIVRKDGLILTNAHVVANKQNVVVKLRDGREFSGVVQAVDQISDLATVKINCDNLSVLKLSDSSTLRPGEWVLAMGSPLNLSNSVTAGIVSAVHRESKELGIRNKDLGYIQTDAVVNFGNSGGPLVNLDGEVVGINTMKVTTGISFAIPSNYANEFLQKAEAFQKKVEAKKSGGWFGSKDSQQDVSPKRRYMGITMLTLTPAISQELQQRIVDFPDIIEGVFVHKVVVGSPAFNAGVRPGDIIVGINGDDVKTSNDVYSATESNDRLTIKIVRGQQSLLLSVIPEEVQ